MIEKSLIDLMVDETFSSERAYKQLELLPFERIEIEAIFDKRRNCFVLNLAGLSIEIPKNWGPFKNRISQNFSLDRSEDYFFLIPVIENILNKTIDAIDFKLGHFDLFNLDQNQAA